MANTVFAAAMSHAPHITAFPAMAPADARDRFYAGMQAAGEALRAARPEVIVIVSSDHFHNLFTDRMPAFCVGLAASYEGPAEGWIRIEPFRVPGAADFSRILMRQFFADGFDPAFAHSMKIEHGLAIPLSFLTPAFDVPIVPILQNCMVPPLPSLRRCYEFGASIRRAIERSGLRVAVVGTGGLSHAPGAPEAGRIDGDFDREFLETLASASPLKCVEISDDRIDSAGFGTWEIRQWITALGAAGGQRARVLAYEPIPSWETGCAVALFDN
jgi:predicted class III extradiol MEMO1 family dioxygenase